MIVSYNQGREPLNIIIRIIIFSTIVFGGVKYCQYKEIQKSKIEQKGNSPL